MAKCHSSHIPFLHLETECELRTPYKWWLGSLQLHTYKPNRFAWQSKLALDWLGNFTLQLNSFSSTPLSTKLCNLFFLDSQLPNKLFIHGVFKKNSDYLSAFICDPVGLTIFCFSYVTMNYHHSLMVPPPSVLLMLTPYQLTDVFS